MPGYVKIWTTLLNNEQFLSLSMSQRGMYMQLILKAKEQRDDGTICFRNSVALGTDCGCERSTSIKTLRLLADKTLLKYKEDGAGVITVTIPKYKQWQNLTVDGVREKSRKTHRKSMPLRPNQSKLKQSIKDDGIPFVEIIEDLNKVIGTNYRPKTETTRAFIRARFKQGFTLADFKSVHRIKFAEWKDDPKMAGYLRPETLYGNKFEGYLQQGVLPDTDTDNPLASKKRAIKHFLEIGHTRDQIAQTQRYDLKLIDEVAQYTNTISQPQVEK